MVNADHQKWLTINWPGKKTKQDVLLWLYITLSLKKTTIIDQCCTPIHFWQTHQSALQQQHRCILHPKNQQWKHISIFTTRLTKTEHIKHLNTSTLPIKSNTAMRRKWTCAAYIVDSKALLACLLHQKGKSTIYCPVITGQSPLTYINLLPSANTEQVMKDQLIQRWTNYLNAWRKDGDV